MRQTILALTFVACARLAAAQTSRAIVPSLGGFWDNVQVSGVANQLRCFVYPAPFTIPAATHLSAFVTVPRAGIILGVAIYPNSDTAGPLASISVSAAAAGLATGTVAAYALTAGTLYRWCACAGHTQINIHGISNGGGAGDLASQLMNAGGTRIALATSVCATGVPPATTGALSSVDLGAFVVGVDS